MKRLILVFIALLIVFFSTACVSLGEVDEAETLNYLPTNAQSFLFIRGNSNQSLLNKVLYKVTGSQMGANFVAPKTKSIFATFRYDQTKLLNKDSKSSKSSNEKAIDIDAIVLGAFRPSALNLLFMGNDQFTRENPLIAWYKSKSYGVQLATPYKRGLYLTTDLSQNLSNKMINAITKSSKNNIDNKFLTNHDVTAQIRDLKFINMLLGSIEDKINNAIPSGVSNVANTVNSALSSSLLGGILGYVTGGSTTSSLSIPTSIDLKKVSSIDVFLDKINSGSNYSLGLSLNFNSSNTISSKIKGLVLSALKKILIEKGYSNESTKELSIDISDKEVSIYGLVLPEDNLIKRVESLLEMF